MQERGLAIVTYNRAAYLGELIDAVLNTVPNDTRVVVCDDGSIDETPYKVSEFPQVIYVRGPNLGVTANKNRALWSLQDCAFICILEDDLFPTAKGWFERYQNASLATGIHHFCRVQDKRVEETIPEFTEWMKTKDYTPIYGPNPRGDFTFITNKVVREVGALNPQFKGAGYAHGEYAERIYKAGLIPHPLKWVDIEELSETFRQKGDQEGGRWVEDKNKIKNQLKANAAILKKLKHSDYIYHPLVLM